MRKRKAYPGSLYDFYGVEQWLTQLAKEGLYLDDFSSFGHLGIFRRGEPKRMCYHLEPDLSQYRCSFLFWKVPAIPAPNDNMLLA